MADFDPQGYLTFYASAPMAHTAAQIGFAETEQRRLNRYSTAWAFYHGRHWGFEREDGDPLVTLNYVAAIVNKHVSMLVRGGVRWDADLPFRETIAREVGFVWEQNGGRDLLWRIAQSGSVTGDHFLMVTWRRATTAELQIRPGRPGYVVLDLLQPSQVFPEWDPERRGVMTKCKIVKQFYYPKAGAPTTLEVRTQTVTITAERQVQETVEGRLVTRAIAGEIVTETPSEDGKTTIREVSPNLLGEVPVVHWPNVPNSADVFGIGDAGPVVPIQMELNEKATDASDIINYWASPIIVIKGMKVDTLDMTSKTVWSNIPADGDVDVLKKEAPAADVLEYVRFLRTSLHELGNVPEGSLGSNDWKGDTGEILASKMQPLLERRDAKVATWVVGLRRVNYFICRYMNLCLNVPMPTDRCKKTGGLVLQRTRKEVNAYGQPVVVVASSTVVVYDHERRTPKELTTDEVATLREGENDDLVVSEDVTFRDPETGVDRTQKLTMQRVPVGEVVVADPYRIEPVFPDNLPKDQVKRLQAMIQLQKAGAVDREWIMRNSDEIDPDEIADLLERTQRERVFDTLLQGLVSDRLLDVTDAEILEELSEAGGDIKKVIAILGKANAAATLAQQQAEAAAKTNVGGSVTEPEMAEAGKKRRKEK